jgi:DNA polymerase I
MASKSYFSYWKVEHKHGAVIPEGRILINTENSFTYQESGIEGIILASRLMASELITATSVVCRAAN